MSLDESDVIGLSFYQKLSPHTICKFASLSQDDHAPGANPMHMSTITPWKANRITESSSGCVQPRPDAMPFGDKANRRACVARSMTDRKRTNSSLAGHDGGLFSIPR